MKKRFKMIGSVLVVAVALVFVISFVFANTGQNSAATETYRPQHCDENGCVMDSVWEQLPEYPENFYEVWVQVYFSRFDIAENFSIQYPDENYYKQPEFYANTFEDQCKNYYTILEPNKKVMYFVAGSGPYPGDVVIDNITQGETIRTVVYWHAGCAIVKYQGFSLQPTYPQEAFIKMADIGVEQDPKIAESCFEVVTNPRNILLEPTYPIYFSNWTTKVEALIKVKEGCPSGSYVLQLIPGDVDAKTNSEWQKIYGIKMASMKVGGAWQIFLNVV